MSKKLVYLLLPALLLTSLRVLAADTETPLARAVDRFQMGEIDNAKELLSQALAGGLSPADALKARNDIGIEPFLKMLADASLNPLVSQVLNLAAQEERRTLTSAEVLQADVKDLLGDFRSRQLALERLAAAGDVAVPYLLPLLADPVSEEKRAYAHLALARLGEKALWPLCAILESADPMLRANAAIALGNLGSRRAIPYLKQVAENPAELDSVRSQARQALSRIAGEGADRLPAAAVLFLQSADELLSQTPRTVAAFDTSAARIWSWQAGALQSRQLPAFRWPAEMAQVQSLRALTLDPDSKEAASDFICTVFALQALPNAIVQDQFHTPSQKPSQERSPLLKTEAVAVFGFELQAAALEKFMALGWDKETLLSLGATLDNFKQTHMPVLLDRTPFSSVESAFARAKDYPNPAVRALAAEALVMLNYRLQPIQDAPELLEIALAGLDYSVSPAAMILSSDGDIRNRFASALREGGYTIVEATTAADASALASSQLIFQALVFEEKSVGGSQVINKLLDQPSLKRASLFLVATKSSPAAARAAWPGLSGVFSGQESPDLIRELVGKPIAIDKPAVETISSRSESAFRLLAAASGGIPPQYVTRLSAILDRMPESGDDVAWALGSTRSKEALPALQKALSAQRELASTRSKEALPAHQKTLSSHGYLRTCTASMIAIGVICRANPQEIDNNLPILLEILKGELASPPLSDRDIRRAALTAIGLMNLSPGRSAQIYLDLTK